MNSFKHLALKARLTAQLVLGLRSAALLTLDRILALQPDNAHALPAGRTCAPNWVTAGGPCPMASG